MRFLTLVIFVLYSVAAYAGGVTSPAVIFGPNSQSKALQNQICFPNSSCIDGSSQATTMGAFDGQAESANGATISANVLYMQSCDATHPGLVNTTTQTFAGKKTFSGGLDAGSAIITHVADPSSAQDAATKNFATNASNLATGTVSASLLPNPTATTLGGIESLAAVSHKWINTISTSGVPSATQPACSDLSNGAASCSTDTTNASNISSGTLPAAQLPNPSSSTLGGVRSITAVLHNFLTAISTSGVPSQAQPACSDLSNAAASCSTDTTVATNISSGTLPAARLPNPTASTLGGVESIASVASNFLTAISTSGVPSQARPACADLSNSAASCSTDATNATNISAGTLAVGRGGTGQTTYTDGQLLIGNSTGNTLAKATLTAGTNITITNGNGSISIAASSASTATSYMDIENAAVTTSVASNALTIALKQADGSTDCASGAGACLVSFPSSTTTSGAYNQRSITAALSIVVPSSTTLGTVSAAAEPIWIYIIDNAGTPELAVSVNGRWTQGLNRVVTTTAISGGTSRSTMYSTTARTNVPFVGPIAVGYFTESTAGTWASNATTLEPTPKGTDTWWHGAATSGAATDFTKCTGTCVTISQTPGFLSGAPVRNSTGVYTYTFTTGYFSAIPICITNSYQVGNGTVGCPINAAPTKTSVQVVCESPSAGGTVADAANGIDCLGPK